MFFFNSIDRHSQLTFVMSFEKSFSSDSTLFIERAVFKFYNKKYLTIDPHFLKIFILIIVR